MFEVNPREINTGLEKAPRSGWNRRTSVSRPDRHGHHHHLQRLGNKEVPDVSKINFGEEIG